MANYWVVGASWGGTEHQDQRFVEQGFWLLGWNEVDQPAQYAKAEKMQIGDRIAIKRMKGQGQKGIRIFHIGIIRGVILDANKVVCTVNWVATDMQRDVKESRGCFKSIHGPFPKDEWIEAVFCL
ncbi:MULTISPECIES: hypothetical protein [unclassified Modicisalibacter]|uniref:hypothetical protein n=1 Tax=unclassified Modicisalibacter TaxID=2679913 RepID=UPI001CCD9DFB|nr:MULTISPECIES: hypothetical protein [unclassified Modicisalibacter]MBZ9559085.1 hypothetical protein [Modicisalibacter sp. R2A 31.J]MBZ9576804.1 hypothetical protein [Modicisalibacter sp. MOD 31.J]